jgi:hypothetical protein
MIFYTIYNKHIQIVVVVPPHISPCIVIYFVSSVFRPISIFFLFDVSA